MKIRLAGVVALTLAFGYAGAGLQKAEGKVVVSSSSDRQTRAVVEATNSFLVSLTKDQRQKVQFAFTPQKLGASAPFTEQQVAGWHPVLRLGATGWF